MPACALAAKFVNCASRALPPASVARLQQMLETLETAPSVKSVVAAIATPGRLAAE
jgi:hypothetical protein